MALGFDTGGNSFEIDRVSGRQRLSDSRGLGIIKRFIIYSRDGIFSLATIDLGTHAYNGLCRRGRDGKFCFVNGPVAEDRDELAEPGKQLELDVFPSDACEHVLLSKDSNFGLELSRSVGVWVDLRIISEDSPDVVNLHLTEGKFEHFLCVVVLINP